MSATGTVQRTYIGPAFDAARVYDAGAPLSQAARLMAGRRSPHLVAVLPGTDRPVGVLSASGLAVVLAWGGS